MTCVCGGRKPINIRKFEDSQRPWHAWVDHDGWDEGEWFETWDEAFEWAWWRLF